jgi:hypothetical protein
VLFILCPCGRIAILHSPVPLKKSVAIVFYWKCDGRPISSTSSQEATYIVRWSWAENIHVLSPVNTKWKLKCWCFASTRIVLCANPAHMICCPAVNVCSTQRKFRHFIPRTSLRQRHPVEDAIPKECARFRAKRWGSVSNFPAIGSTPLDFVDPEISLSSRECMTPIMFLRR